MSAAIIAMISVTASMIGNSGSMALLALAGWLARGERPHGSKWLRGYNEVPTVLLLGILAMVIAKPF